MPAMHGSEVGSGANAVLTHCAQVVSSLHQQGGGGDSGALAAHLERLARKAELPEAWQLALDMYSRLGMRDKHCQMLLAKVNCSIRLARCGSVTCASIPWTTHFAGKVNCGDNRT